MDTINCIQRAIDFIEDNICNELSSEVIAGQAFMSNFHFQRLFSVVSGVSLGEYIRNRRLTLAGIDERNENGDGTYGCVLPFPGEIKNMTLMPFNGFHMFYGEPTQQAVAFMRVDNIDNLYSFVKKNGWTQVSEITIQHWGGKECDITTIDGSVMRFFQLD